MFYDEYNIVGQANLSAATRATGLYSPRPIGNAKSLIAEVAVIRSTSGIISCKQVYGPSRTLLGPLWGSSPDVR